MEASFLLVFSRIRRGDGDVGFHSAPNRYSLSSAFPTDGMFAILLPATLAPLVVTLVHGELKAKRLGLTTQTRRWGMLLRTADFRSPFTQP